MAMRQQSQVLRTLFYFYTLCSASQIVQVTSHEHSPFGKAKDGGRLSSEFEGLPDCPIGVPDQVLNQCIQLAYEQLWPFLVKGVPAIGLPAVEPLIYERLPPCPPPGCNGSEGTPTPVFALYNLTVRGLANFTSIRVKLDTKYNSTTYGQLENDDDPKQAKIHVMGVDFKSRFDDLDLHLPGFSDKSPRGAAFTRNVLRPAVKSAWQLYLNTLFQEHLVTLWKDPKISPALALSYFFLPYFLQPQLLNSSL